eukprot:4318573-Amphidinium_carterae.1
MRTFPELMTIIKGLAASVRSVLWTGVILFLLTYTWAVLFTSEFHQGRPTDQAPSQKSTDSTRFSYFGSSHLGHTHTQICFCCTLRLLLLDWQGNLLSFQSRNHGQGTTARLPTM